MLVGYQTPPMPQVQRRSWSTTPWEETLQLGTSWSNPLMLAFFKAFLKRAWISEGLNMLNIHWIFWKRPTFGAIANVVAPFILFSIGTGVICNSNLAEMSQARRFLETFAGDSFPSCLCIKSCLTCPAWSWKWTSQFWLLKFPSLFLIYPLVISHMVCWKIHQQEFDDFPSCIYIYI